jgi:hypothetical protein
MDLTGALSNTMPVMSVGVLLVLLSVKTKYDVFPDWREIVSSKTPDALEVVELIELEDEACAEFCDTGE